MMKYTATTTAIPTMLAPPIFFSASITPPLPLVRRACFMLGIRGTTRLNYGRYATLTLVLRG